MNTRIQIILTSSILSLGWIGAPLQPVPAAAQVEAAGRETAPYAPAGSAATQPLPASSGSVHSAWITMGPRSHEFVITAGPIWLGRGGSYYAHHETHAYSVAVPVAGWLRGYEVVVVDSAGKILPREVMHHLNLVVPHQRELFAPIMRRVGAVGKETGRVQTPPRVGSPVQQGDTLFLTTALHNPASEELGLVYVQVRVSYTPASTRLPMLSIYPFYMDVIMEPGPRSYDLPPGRSERSWVGRPAVAGRILGLGGHLHKYGVLLRLEDLTAGRVIWEARPQLDEQGEVVGMPITRFLARRGVPIHPDRLYRLTAIYDNPTGETIKGGAMGILGGAFLPARGVSWPEVNRSDREYVLDRLAVIEGVHPAGGQGAHGEHGHHHGHGRQEEN